MRECVPVGVGQNVLKASSISAHDVYKLGQFKDDAIKSHSHSFSGTTSTKELTGNYGAENRGVLLTFVSSSVGHTLITEGIFSMQSRSIRSGSVNWAPDHEGSNYSSKFGVLHIDASHSHTFSGTTAATGASVTRMKSVGINYIIKI